MAILTHHTRDFFEKKRKRVPCHEFLDRNLHISLPGNESTEPVSAVKKYSKVQWPLKSIYDLTLYMSVTGRLDVDTG